MSLPSATDLDRSVSVSRLRHQFDQGLLGLPLVPLLLTWTASSDGDEEPTGYQLRHRRPDSDWVEDEPVSGYDPIEVPAPGGALTARERRHYAVRVATATGWSEWSDSLEVEGGLSPADYTATMIDVPSEVAGPVPILRTEFDIPQSVSSARLYLTALGTAEVRLNGRLVDGALLTPGWTSYRERVLVDTVDVTELLQSGRNAIAVSVADGWYRGRFGFAGHTEIYGDRIGALLQLETVDGSGDRTVVATGREWRGGFGPIRSASIYDGTAIDFREDAGDASLVGFDDSAWTAADAVPFDVAVLEPRGVAPVRVIDERAMRAEERDGRVMLDAGQNISGWVRLRVEGRAGQTVTVRHAEVLEPDGALHTAALRSAKATDTYVLARDGEILLEPVFTFHGFQHAEVSGADRVLEATAVAISTDLPRRSSFSSSDEALDRFHENTLWSLRDNFVSVPTDCPQRDERLGWTGDAQAFAPTASTLVDSRSFWASWLRDLELDQTDEGGVASVVPDIIRHGDMIMGGIAIDPNGRAGWADAATIVPMAVHQSYGGTDIVRRQLSSMRRWVGHLERRAGTEVLLPHEPFQYGDWLDPDAPADRPWAAKVSSDYVANAFYVQSARLLAQAERLVGDEAEARRLDDLAATVAEEMWRKWSDEAFRTQTGAALALEFRVAPEAERTAVAAALAENVRNERGRIATGFLGTPLVLFALSNTGHLAEAYSMLLRREAPSWLYQVERGATTVWERWDAIREDGSIHTGDMDTTEGDGMISFNHYAYGAMLDWVYRTVAGLAPAEPGYRVASIAPRPGVGLDRARASIDTAYGELSIDWRIDDQRLFEAEVHVPFGVRARLDLPLTPESVVTVDGAATAGELGHGRHTIRIERASVAGAPA
ncbi:alpha-L-rhamnosidase [Desertivibrio insolitus]|uniref:alpha-L-rhamnosidase n=1 Tax=Herbiconiux sp. SYSU D00978 TaxID=2812562 RepID=UPI001A95FD64|nr:alpha-L-rhamnosidase [Herbiconiux sp. SYSU D00978]